MSVPFTVFTMDGRASLIDDTHAETFLRAWKAALDAPVAPWPVAFIKVEGGREKVTFNPMTIVAVTEKA